MRRPTSRAAGYGRLLIPVLFGAAILGACSDQQPVASRAPLAPAPPSQALAAFDCVGSISGAMSCKPSSGSAGGASAVLIGGQNLYMKLTSSAVSYTEADSIFQFSLTVQNLMNEAIGTPNGTVPDPQGIQVFFHTGPTVTAGTGSIDVVNADGTGTFTAGNQPYFAYDTILAKNQVSAAKPWRLKMPPTVETFSFTLLIETDVQYLLVINEVLANPLVPTDLNGEWFEIYNAGTRSVNLQNLVIADSASTVRQPYHLITGSVVVPSGGYATLGSNADTTTNGGATIDYSYGSALALANSIDAIKISRVYGTDTLTIDRVAYTSGTTSAKNGITRELKNPALDNSDVDGTNWADALVTATYGTGTRGTPKAQNSTYTATP